MVSPLNSLFSRIDSSLLAIRKIRGSMYYPNVAKVEDAADSRRRGCSRRSLLQTLGNAEDAVSSAFPEGKQHGVFWVSLDVTAGDIQSECEKWRRAWLFLSFQTFRRVVYATVGY